MEKPPDLQDLSKDRPQNFRRSDILIEGGVCINLNPLRCVTFSTFGAQNASSFKDPVTRLDYDAASSIPYCGPGSGTANSDINIEQPNNRGGRSCSLLVLALRPRNTHIRLLIDLGSTCSVPLTPISNHLCLDGIHKTHNNRHSFCA